MEIPQGMNKPRSFSGWILLGLIAAFMFGLITIPSACIYKVSRTNPQLIWQYCGAWLEQGK